MENLSWMSLIWLVFSPLVAGGLILCPVFPNHEVKIRRFAKGFASLHFIYTILFLIFFNPANYSMSFEKELTFFGHSWLKTLGITATFAIDGLSMLMIVLTSFLVLLALVASKSNITSRHKLYYALVLILQTAILGVFCAKDMFLFFLFWELELVPMYFLISLWGGGNSKKSAMKFLLYTFFGSIFMLFAMLILYFYNFAISGLLTSNMEMLNMSETACPFWFQLVVFICFFIAFAVKLPIVPFHTWLADAHSDAPTPVSMLLAGILLKMGAYGLIRFNMQIFPEIFQLVAPVILVMGLVNLLWGGFLAYVQTDIKRIIAFSSISHMGIVLLGLGALNVIGFSGAVFQMVAHGFISAGMFMVAGVVYLRTKTRELVSLGGLGEVMPTVMFLAMPIFLAALGLPLLVGFPGELMSFIGVFNSSIDAQALVKIVAVLAIFGLLLSAGYILRLVHKTFFSNILEQFKSLKDVSPHEFSVLFVLICAIFVFGMFPMAIVDVFSTFTGIIIDVLKV